MHLEEQETAQTSSGSESRAGVVAVGKQMRLRFFCNKGSMTADGGVLSITACLLVHARQPPENLPKEGAYGQGDCVRFDQLIPSGPNIFANLTGGMIMPGLPGEIGVRHQTL